MATTDFRPDVHGFPFPNRFVNEVARLPNGDRIRTSGRCGGMSAAALDIYYADLAAPRFDWSTFPRGVPPDPTPVVSVHPQAADPELLVQVVPGPDLGRLTLTEESR